MKSRCTRCYSQRKGCSLFSGRAPVIEVRDTPDAPVASSSATVPPPSASDHVDHRDTKRRKVQNSPEAPLPAPVTRQSRPSVPEVVLPLRRPIRPRPIVPTAPPSAPPSEPPSPAFSFAPLSPPTDLSGTSNFGPPSTLGTSRSVPDFSTQSLELELSILRSRLSATEGLLRREQSRAQQEVESLRSQFAAERTAYLAFIEQLKGNMRVD